MIIPVPPPGDDFFFIGTLKERAVQLCYEGRLQIMNGMLDEVKEMQRELLGQKYFSEVRDKEDTSKPGYKDPFDDTEWNSFLSTLTEAQKQKCFAYLYTEEAISNQV